MPFQDYKIASGWNNAAGLANLETQFPKYQGKPLIVRGRGFNPGQKRIGANFQVYITGKRVILWRFRLMSIVQYNYWQANYTVGGNSYSGKNTIRSKKVDDTYGNYSVTSQLPSPDELQTKADSYENVVISHVIEAAL
jgi:hypothetical protein